MYFSLSKYTLFELYFSLSKYTLFESSTPPPPPPPSLLLEQLMRYEAVMVSDDDLTDYSGSDEESLSLDHLPPLVSRRSLSGTLLL